MTPLRTVITADDVIDVSDNFREAVCRVVSDAIWDGYVEMADICESVCGEPLMPLVYLGHIARNN